MIKPEDIANVRGMTIKDGKWSMDLEVSREVMLGIAASCVTLLQEKNAPNFIEMEVRSANYDIPHTILSIGYRNRPTPLEIIDKLRGELLWLYQTENLWEEAQHSIANLMRELGYGNMLDD